jgi:outer membrane protein
MKRMISLMSVAALVGGSVVVSARAETLDEVLATAYATNPTLMAARSGLKVTDEGVPQALSNWRPTVSLSAAAGRQKYYSNQYPPPAVYDNTMSPWNYTVTITEPLYRGGRTVAATKEAKAAVVAGQAKLTSTEQAVLLSAATAFLDVVRDEATVKLNINNVHVLQRQLDATRERFEVGEVTRTDVSQAEARLSQAIADRIAAEGSLQVSRAHFDDVVGRPPQSPEEPKAEPKLPASFGEVKALALAHNPNVVEADWTATAAKHGIDVAYGSLLPTVALVGSYSRYYETYARNVMDRNEQALLQVSVPLYQGGVVYSKVRAQKHTYGERLILADQVRRDTLQSADQSWQTLLSARARVKSFEAQIAANKMALAGVEEEAKVGSRTVLDVLNAEQELFTSQVNLVRALHDEMVGAFDLKAALGQMTAEGLGLHVKIYDPAKHYDAVRGKWFGTGSDKAAYYKK